jgi:hypothetical protein
VFYFKYVASQSKRLVQNCCSVASIPNVLRLKNHNFEAPLALQRAENSSDWYMGRENPFARNHQRWRLVSQYACVRHWCPLSKALGFDLACLQIALSNHSSSVAYIETFMYAGVAHQRLETVGVIAIQSTM